MSDEEAILADIETALLDAQDEIASYRDGGGVPVLVFALECLQRATDAVDDLVHRS